MSGTALLHRQLSPEDLQQLLAWYRIRHMLFRENGDEQDIKTALEFASLCEHPNAVWLTKLFLGCGCDVGSREEARQVFLGCESDPRALCFAGLLGGLNDEIRRAADLGDAFAQALVAEETRDEERFLWAEKSAAQGEREGFYWLGRCYQDGNGCEQDAERARDSFLAVIELGDVTAKLNVGKSLDKDDPQRFVWFGRATAMEQSSDFLNEMGFQIRNFNSGTGYAKIVFVIGRALKGHINNEERTVFGNSIN
jgi:TPR repeat protein